MFNELVPALAVGLFLIFVVVVALRERQVGEWTWLLPASASLLFLGFSLYAIASEGPFGFWLEHTRSAWGNQIWIDLLLALAVAWAALLPQLRQQHMRPTPWLILIILSGCVGMTAMVARLTYLQGRKVQNR